MFGIGTYWCLVFGILLYVRCGPVVADRYMASCNGQHCADKCAFDALHVVRGVLAPYAHGQISSDAEGSPCHEWAKSQAGYSGTYCGNLEDMSEDGAGVRLPFVARGEAMSLVFCSDGGIEPGSGERVCHM